MKERESESLVKELHGLIVEMEALRENEPNSHMVSAMQSKYSLLLRDLRNLTDPNTYKNTSFKLMEYDRAIFLGGLSDYWKIIDMDTDFILGCSDDENKTFDRVMQMARESVFVPAVKIKCGKNEGNANSFAYVVDFKKENLAFS